MNRVRISFAIGALLLLLISAQAQTQWQATVSLTFGGNPREKSLQELVDQAAHTVLAKFADKKLTQEQLSITLIDLRNPQHPMASWRGNERVYPASVVKLFYFVAVHRWLEDKKMQET